MKTNNTASPIEFLECSTVVWLIHLLRVLKPSLVSLLSFPRTDDNGDKHLKLLYLQWCLPVGDPVDAQTPGGI